MLHGLGVHLVDRQLMLNLRSQVCMYSFSSTNSRHGGVGFAYTQLKSVRCVVVVMKFKANKIDSIQ